MLLAATTKQTKDWLKIERSVQLSNSQCLQIGRFVDIVVGTVGAVDRYTDLRCGQDNLDSVSWGVGILFVGDIE